MDDEKLHARYTVGYRDGSKNQKMRMNHFIKRLKQILEDNKLTNGLPTKIRLLIQEYERE